MFFFVVKNAIKMMALKKATHNSNITVLNRSVKGGWFIFLNY